MKTEIAKPLSAVIIIISFIVLFLSHDEVAVAISVFMLVVGMTVLLTTTVIKTVEGRWEEMEKVELKPCPFCGEIPKMNTYAGLCVLNYYVICRNSDCEMHEVYTGMDKSPEAVAEKWNRRVRKGEQE